MKYYNSKCVKISKAESIRVTYYKVGNWLDGYKRMNDLKITVEGASTAAKLYAGIELGLNASNIYYDTKSAISDYYNINSGNGKCFNN